MHRKVKGLLSLILTIAMVTVSAAPVFAEELPSEQLVEEQPVVEVAETETEPALEQDIAETVPVEEQSVEETESVAEQPTEGTELVEEPSTVQDITEAEPATEPDGEQLTQEQPVTEIVSAEPVPEEPSEAAESALSTDAELEDWYDNLLTEEQKKFKVYSGNQPLSELTSDADILSKLTFMSMVMGVTPDSEALDTQSGTLVRALLLDYRQGDLNFYSLLTWNVWSVDSNGVPQAVTATSSSLKKLATKDNFLKSAYIKNNGIGTDPQIEFQNPILEPVWSCINYEIPVYDGDGNDTGTTIPVNAENYNNLSFPDVKADSWKLVYAGEECQLNAASEIWTNQTNGIRTVGRDFNETQAKLQAVVSPTVLKEGTAEFTQPDWYEGQPMAAPIVSSETNGIENITYFYKEAEASDDTYTTTVPEKAGVYTAMAVFAATEEYEAVIKTANFNILEAIPVVPELQEGIAEFTQPDWYEGQPMAAPIVSSETNGIENVTYFYKEAGAEDSTYTTTVPDKAGKYTAAAVFAATEVYREVIVFSDFEILPNIPVAEADVTAPVISGVSDGQTYYGDQAVTVTDEHLQTVTVNGEAVAISDNRADITLKPAEDVYKIIAADEAGNKTEYTVEVLETWVRDGINDNGKKKLRSERVYKLGSGQWTVGSDSTVYSSGITFYVKNGGEYDFSKK